MFRITNATCRVSLSEQVQTHTPRDGWKTTAQFCRMHAGLLCFLWHLFQDKRRYDEYIAGASSWLAYLFKDKKDREKRLHW